MKLAVKILLQFSFSFFFDFSAVVGMPLGFFTNPPQNKNANIANFISAMPLESNWTNEVCNLEM